MLVLREQSFIMSDSCKTKYPIVMVHGMGFRDMKYISYWGRIPKVLKENGAEIYFGNQDSNAPIEYNAQVIKNTIESILIKTDVEKVNIIAHSKGGLDARYMISTLGMEDKVASLSTISTPHNGSITVGKLLKFPDFLVRWGSKVTDIWFKLLGDKNPDTYKVIRQFTTAEAVKFNEFNRDSEKVYYQSFAFVMKNAFSDIFMFIPYLVVKFFEGENDGLLSPRSVKWTNFRGVFRGNSGRGISHCDEVDLRRRRLSAKRGSGISDITKFYKSLVEELKSFGY